VKRSLRRYSFC